MDDREIAALAEEALNAAARTIQDRLGVMDGGLASIFFSDDVVHGLLKDYARFELDNKE